MKPFVRLIALLVTTSSAGTLFGETYTGTVVSVEGTIARVAMNGGVFPPVGARGEIFFKMAGIDEEISVATGSASRIDQGNLLMKIGESTGTVEKGHLVRFGPPLPSTPSPSPQPTSAPLPPATSSIAGRWNGNEPGGDEIIFTFAEDGSVTYVRQKGKKKNTLRGKYRTNCATTPCRLELFSFQVNGVRAKGETINGLFELQGNDMKFDLSKDLQRDPGKGFTKGAITLTRVPSETPPVPSASPQSSPTSSLPPSVPFPTPAPSVAPPPVTSAPIPPAALELGKKGVSQYSAGDIAGAIASYTEAIRLAPGAAVFYLNRANAYLYKPDYRSAITDANKALELKIERADDAYVIRGTAQAGLGNYDAAIADCNRALKINPRHALAYNNRANDKLRLRNYKGALADCDKALSLEPNMALAYYNRGYAHINLGNSAKALADWKKAVQLQPSFGAELNPKIGQLEASQPGRSR